MKPNESLLDRFLRLVLGSVMLVVAVRLSSGWWTLPLYIFGALLGITGLTGFCTFYELFGVSTWKGERKNDSTKGWRLFQKEKQKQSNDDAVVGKRSKSPFGDEGEE